VDARTPAAARGASQSDTAAGFEARPAEPPASRAGTLYKTLFDCAGLLLAARSENKLLTTLCRQLVESGLFISATIGSMDRQSIWRHHGSASCRNVTGFRAAIAAYRPNEPNPPLGLLAWTARKSLVANHYATDPRFARYRAFATNLGIGAIAGIVIRRNRRRWAVLTVTAADENFFDADIVSLLERLASIVGQRLHEFDLKTALTAERAAQHRAARTDALTGLLNAQAFAEQVSARLARAVAWAATTAIARLDIEGLDDIFQHWGYAAGEAVVRAFATRLRAGLRPGDGFGHCGAGKFAIAFEVQADASLTGFAARLREALEAPFLLPSGQSLRVTYVFGAALCPQDAAQAAALLEHAETALYAARNTPCGGPRWRLFEDVVPGESKPEPVAARLSRDALCVHYQPVLELNSGRIISVEALARLHDHGRLSLPAQFLPGLLMDGRLTLFRQVLRTALAQLAAWDRDGITLNLSVNIDAPVLMLEDTASEVRDALAAAAIAPYRLVLEILETHEFLDFFRARERIEALRRIGVRLALDDAGAGYASMLKIRELPLDIVKLDRAFIGGLRKQPDDLLFVSAFQTLTATRDIALVVEGVESEDVLDALRMLGVRQAQGFLIARPMSPASLSAWLPAQTAVKGSFAPQTLLGAYAVHLLWLRAFNSSRNRDGLVVAMDANAAFSLTEFFAAGRLPGSPLAQSYEKLSARMTQPNPARSLILEAAIDFRAKLMAALRAEG